MGNHTAVKYFQLLAFENTDNKPFISIFFFLIYLAGILMNSSIITVICLERHLHSPMFLFICNLSFVDIFYTTVIVPKLLEMLLSENNIISFNQCFSQLYFFIAVASAEEILLFIMAYDRYVAICSPLHYHHIMSRRNCIVITTGIWMSSCLNSLIFTVSVLNMTSCHSNQIPQIFCDAKSLTKISCTGTRPLYIILSTEILFYGLVPFSCSLMSYIKIFTIILHIRSNDGRKKAFSTCSSHLSVITMYYASSVSVYMIPPSEYSHVLERVFTVLYTTVTPTLNPIIYSLQNADLKRSLQRLGTKNLFVLNTRFSTQDQA